MWVIYDWSSTGFFLGEEKFQPVIFEGGFYVGKILDWSRLLVDKWSRSWIDLVGGFNQPIWKICSSNWIISPGIGVKIPKMFELPPPRDNCSPPIFFEITSGNIFLGQEIVPKDWTLRHWEALGGVEYQPKKGLKKWMIHLLAAENTLPQVIVLWWNPCIYLEPLKVPYFAV